MPLVEAGDEGGSEEGDDRPTDGPSRVSQGRKGLSPGAEKEDAEQAVTEDVSALANVEVPGLEVRQVHAEEIMQQGEEDAAGGVGGEIFRRLNSDDDQPQDGGDPGFESFVAVGGQASGAPAVPEFPPFAENAKSPP